jgi:hypothetical protein
MEDLKIRKKQRECGMDSIAAVDPAAEQKDLV